MRKWSKGITDREGMAGLSMCFGFQKALSGSLPRCVCWVKAVTSKRGIPLGAAPENGASRPRSGTGRGQGCAERRHPVLPALSCGEALLVCVGIWL